MDSRQQEVSLLRAANASGYLNPIFEYLARKIRDAEKPERPQGQEWPFVRAFKDGELNAYLEMHRWLEGRTRVSPDAAENTGG